MDNNADSNEMTWLMIFALVSILVAAFFGALQAGETAKPAVKEKTETFRGTIQAADYDDNEKITALEIEIETIDKDGDSEYDWYAIEMDPVGRKLIALVDKTVELVAVKKTDKKGTKLFVKSFRELKPVAKKKIDAE